eukprot:2783305-Alexandrium_andersonii.AAC.1
MLLADDMKVMVVQEEGQEEQEHISNVELAIDTTADYLAMMGARISADKTLALSTSKQVRKALRVT